MKSPPCDFTKNIKCRLLELLWQLKLISSLSGKTELNKLFGIYCRHQRLITDAYKLCLLKDGIRKKYGRGLLQRREKKIKQNEQRDVPTESLKTD